MPEPPSLDVEPERTDKSRSRVTLVAVGALVLLLVLIAAIVIAGRSDDEGTDGARVASITDLLNAERNGDRVEVRGQVEAVQEEGRIFALRESNVGEPDATSQGGVLVISESANVQEGQTVTVTGRIYDLESPQVTEAAGRELGGADGFPDFRTQPVVVASDVSVG